MKSGATSASAMTLTSTAVAPGLNQLSASKSWISVWVKIVHGGTAAGLARPGSRVSERSSCGVPMPPAVTTSWAAEKSRAKRRLNPTCSGMPFRSAASIARSASARVIAIGFSTKTALPAWAAATTRSAWAVLAQVMATASMRGSSMRAWLSVSHGTPSASPSRRAEASNGSATATSSASGRRRAKVVAW